MHQDKNIDWARQRLVIEVAKFNSLGANGASLNSGGGFLAEYEGLGFWGISMATATSAIIHSMKAPDNWDFNRPIGVIIEWSSGSTTATDTVHWVVLVKSVAPGEALAAPATEDALDTAIDSFTLGSGVTGHTIRNSSRGIINPGRIDRGDRLVISIAAPVANPGHLFLHGIIFDYMPKMTRGPGARIDRKYDHEQVDWKY